MRRRKNSKLGLALFLSGLILSGCAKTKVENIYDDARGERLPRPDEVLVYDFSVTRSDVTLDHSIVAQAVGKLEGADESDDTVEVGLSLANVLSEVLVEQLRTLGMTARRAHGVPPSGNILLIHGQFMTIDEGSETVRLVIGLGRGASHVRTRVQVYETAAGEPRLLEKFDTATTSTFKPGMAETVGAGAVAGRAAVSAAVSTGVGVASEKWRDDVEADTRRTAKKIAKELSNLFLEQGWVTQEQVEQTLEGVHIP